MAIRSGFFNSVDGDRKYDASRFAEYFASFIGNGVFPNPSDCLQVISNNDMTVTVKAGKCWINGYIMINDDDYILEIEPADGVLNRIDRVVARYDVVDREIRLEVKKGTFADNPVAQNLQRDADAYELGLADIYVSAGVTSISQADITDLRLNSELCGIVHGTVEQVDTTTLFNQYQAWLQETQNTAQNDIDNLQTQLQQDWDAWFQSIQDALDGDTAGNLLNMINDLAGDGRTDETVKHNADNIQSLQITLESHINNIKAHQGVPTGAILMWSGSADNIPEGWGLCDGSTYQRVDGTGTITAPDLRDRFIVGAGNEYEVGDVGGEKEVVLTEDQIPMHNHGSGTLSTNSAGNHSHSGSTSNTGSHSHSYSYEYSSSSFGGMESGSQVGTGSKTGTTGTAGSHSHTVSINSAGSHSHSITGNTASIGGDQAHENRPPYFALAFIMKL